jgi:hypothetical protein
MAATKMQRDTSRALGIVMEMQEAVQRGERVTMTALNELAQILGTMDARTGRRDPSARKGRRSTVKKAKR